MVVVSGARVGQVEKSGSLGGSLATLSFVQVIDAKCCPLA